MARIATLSQEFVFSAIRGGLFTKGILSFESFFLRQWKTTFPPWKLPDSWINANSCWARPSLTFLMRKYPTIPSGTPRWWSAKTKCHSAWALHRNATQKTVSFGNYCRRTGCRGCSKLLSKSSHVLTIMDANNEFISARQDIREKDNEIINASNLIDTLDIQGSNVTADALNTQTKFAAKIIAENSDCSRLIRVSPMNFCVDSSNWEHMCKKLPFRKQTKVAKLRKINTSSSGNSFTRRNPQ